MQPTDAPAATHAPTAARLVADRRNAWALIAAGAALPAATVLLAAATGGEQLRGIGAIVVAAVLIGPILLVAGVVARRRNARLRRLLAAHPWTTTTLESARVVGVRLPRVVLGTGDGRVLGLAREPRWRLTQLRRPAGARLWCAGPSGSGADCGFAAVSVPGPGTLLLARVPRDERQARRWGATPT